jgi:two-component system sensor histidine kinase YesM
MDGGRTVPYKMNIFSKMLMLLILLLIPIVFLYSFSNRITNQVIQDQIQSSNLNQLTFVLHQLDSNMDNLSMFPVIFGYDPYIREFVDKLVSPTYDILKAESRITEKLSLQSVSSGWSNDLTLVIPAEKKVLSSSIYMNGTSSWAWDDKIRTSWTYAEDSTRGQPVGTFIREISEPARAQFVRQANAIYQVKFPIQNISDLLDVYK